MYNIISKTKYTYAFSITLTVLSIFSLFVWGLKYDIDFTGGTRTEIQFNTPVPTNIEIQETLASLNLKSLVIQSTAENSAIIRYAALSDAVNQSVFKALNDKYSGSKQLSADFTDSTISGELKTKSFQAIALAIVVIMAYIPLINNSYWRYRPN